MASQQGRFTAGFFSIYQKYFFLSFIFAIAILAASFSLTLIKSGDYQATTTIVIERPAGGGEIELLVDEARSMDYEAQLRSRPVLGKALLESGFSVSTKPGLLQRLLRKIPMIANDDLDPLTKDQELSILMAEMQKKIEVERSGVSNVIHLTVKAKDPEQAAKLVNFMTAYFIQYRREKMIEHAEARMVATEQEMKVVRAELAKKIKERTEFLDRNGWGDFEVELRSASENVARLRDSLQYLKAYQSESSSAERNISSPFYKDQKLSNRSVVEISRELALADSQYNRVSASLPQESAGVLRARLEKEMLESVLSDKLSDPRYREKITEKQLAEEQEKLSALLKQEPWHESIKASIAYFNERLLKLTEEVSQIRFLLTQWQNQPQNTFNGIQILEEALVMPRRTLLEVLPKAIVLSCVLGFLGFLILPIFLTLWNQEIRNLQNSSHIPPDDVHTLGLQLKIKTDSKLESSEQRMLIAKGEDLHE